MEPSVFKIRLNKIDTGKKIEPVRVMLTGDWHISPIVSDIQGEWIREAILNMHPDLIILQGDLVDSPRELSRDASLEQLKAQLVTCSEAAPTIMVLGSHDYILPINPAKVVKWSLEQWGKICEECNIQLLQNEWYENDKIKVFGVMQSPEYCLREVRGVLKHKCNPEVLTHDLREFKQEFKNLPSDKAAWLAAHSPVMEDTALSLCKDFDVMSFGHTHGGIVPRGLDDLFESKGWTWGLISPEKTLFPKKARGVSKIKDRPFTVINSGMVGAQYCVPKFFQKFNFINAAEITVVDIEHKK